MRYLRLLLLPLAAGCVDLSGLFDGPLSSNATGSWNLRSLGGKPLPVKMRPQGFSFLFPFTAYPDTGIVQRSVLTLSDDGTYQVASAVQFPGMGPTEGILVTGHWTTPGFSHTAISIGNGSGNTGAVSHDTLTLQIDTLTLVFTR